MNRISNALLAFVLLSSLILISCGAAEEPDQVATSGAKSGIAVLKMIAEKTMGAARPSGPLGIFSGLYLSQGIILPASSAIEGMEAISRFLEGQKSSSTDENFALLKEVGSVLQVDVIDTLNRSSDRVEALDSYTQSLKNAGILMERKIAELDALHDEQRNTVRIDRKTVSNIKKTLRTALKEQNYTEAGEYEEELASANAALAEIETKEQQTSDMMKRFQALLEVAEHRVQAVDNNREILIAGLRVIKVPGIVDLNILEEGRSWRRRGGSSIFGN